MPTFMGVLLMAVDGFSLPLTSRQRAGLLYRKTCPDRQRREHRRAATELITFKTSDADSGPAIVVLQDFRVSLALICHDCRADLTEADTVSPAGSSQDKAARLFVDDECRAVKMRA